MSAGENIIKFRKQTGMTSRSLAEAVGVTPATMSRYEHGQIAVIPAEMIRKISEALHVSSEQLVSDDPSYSYLSESAEKKISSRDEEEKKLLEGYYGLSPELQEVVRKICELGLSE